MTVKKVLKTKDKVLLEAVKMYNESGVTGITSRHIAEKMGISHGNLDYHYKTKEDLMLDIYKKMRTEMSETYRIRKQNSTSLEHFHLLLIQLEEFQYRYRFFNLDVLEISRSYPKVSKLLKKTFALRKKQMQELFEEFIRDGYIRNKSASALEQVQHILRIVVTFWLCQREILPTHKFTEKGEMVATVWALMLPYLTASGKIEQQRAIRTYGYKHI